MHDADYMRAIDNYIETVSGFNCSLTKYPDGINRLAFTSAESNAIDWAKGILESFGYVCDYDAFLNLHARDPRTEKARVVVGTHLDSVINAGKYDGTVGLITFLLSIQLSRNEGRPFAYPVDFVVFRAEESTVFKEALLGSKVATGLYDTNDLLKKIYRRIEDIDPAYEKLYEADSAMKSSAHWTALDLVRVQKRKDVDMSMIRKGCWFFRDYEGRAFRNYEAYFEIHIEQGRVLQTHNKKIGIVTSIRAPLRYIVTLKGRRDHSGGTPMGKEYRKDVLCAASECVLAIERICEEEAKTGVDIVGTVGVLNIPGMGINIIPGECNFTIDLRSNNPKERLRIFRRIQRIIKSKRSSRGIEVSFERTENTKPVNLMSNVSTQFYDGIEYRIKELGYPWMRLPSGAGHDAMRMSQVGIPVCLLFIPCKDGISHSPQEFASTEDIFIGAKVLEGILTKGWNRNAKMLDTVDDTK